MRIFWAALMGIGFLVNLLNCAPEDKKAQTGFDKYRERRAQEKESFFFDIWRGQPTQYAQYATDYLLEVKRLTDLALGAKVSWPKCQSPERLHETARYKNQRILKLKSDECSIKRDKTSMRVLSNEKFELTYAEGKVGDGPVERLKYSTFRYEVWNQTKTKSKELGVEVHALEDPRLELELMALTDEGEAIYAFDYSNEFKILKRSLKSNLYKAVDNTGDGQITISGTLFVDLKINRVRSMSDVE